MPVVGLWKEIKYILGEVNSYNQIQPMSRTSSLHHIVINTYCRRMTIDPKNEEHLYRYIWKFLTEQQCRLLRIGGIANHLHILIDLHPTVSMAKLMENMKRNSSMWMKKSGMFPLFEGWGKEYFSFSKSQEEKEKIIKYIMNQKEHHLTNTFEDELKTIIREEKMEWDDLLLT